MMNIIKRRIVITIITTVIILGFSFGPLSPVRADDPETSIDLGSGMVYYPAPDHSYNPEIEDFGAASGEVEDKAFEDTHPEDKYVENDLSLTAHPRYVDAEDDGTSYIYIAITGTGYGETDFYYESGSGISYSWDPYQVELSIQHKQENVDAYLGVRTEKNIGINTCGEEEEGDDYEPTQGDLALEAAGFVPYIGDYIDMTNFAQTTYEVIDNEGEGKNNAAEQVDCGDSGYDAEVGQVWNIEEIDEDFYDDDGIAFTFGTEVLWEIDGEEDNLHEELEIEATIKNRQEQNPPGVPPDVSFEDGAEASVEIPIRSAEIEEPTSDNDESYDDMEVTTEGEYEFSDEVMFFATDIDCWPGFFWTDDPPTHRDILIDFDLLLSGNGEQYLIEDIKEDWIPWVWVLVEGDYWIAMEDETTISTTIDLDDDLGLDPGDEETFEVEVIANVQDAYGGWEESVSYDLTIEWKPHLTIGGAGGGYTTPSHGTYEYEYGDEVDVTAYPNSGYEFDQWTGDRTTSSSSITLEMTEDKEVTPNFESEGDWNCPICGSPPGECLCGPQGHSDDCSCEYDSHECDSSCDSPCESGCSEHSDLLNSHHTEEVPEELKVIVDQAEEHDVMTEPELYEKEDDWWLMSDSEGEREYLIYKTEEKLKIYNALG